MNSELAEFGTQTEQNADLWMYAQGRPIPYDKTTEEKINHHFSVLKQEFRGDIKNRNCQSENTSVVSSASSNISKLVTAGIPSKQKNIQNRRNSATTNQGKRSTTMASTSTSRVK